jgi:hypothetical protein
MTSRGLEIELAWTKVDNKLKKPGPVFTEITKTACVSPIPSLSSHNLEIELGHRYNLGAEYIYRVNDDTEVCSESESGSSVFVFAAVLINCRSDAGAMGGKVREGVAGSGISLRCRGSVQ